MTVASGPTVGHLPFLSNLTILSTDEKVSVTTVPQGHHCQTVTYLILPVERMQCIVEGRIIVRHVHETAKRGLG